MARPATARPPGEHLTTLARMVRQVDVDKRMARKRKLKLLKLFSEAMKELQQELGR